MTENDTHPTDRRTQYPVTFVEIMFAVVLGASVIRFSDLLFPPAWTSPNFWALAAGYFTAIASWFGWHRSTNRYPYTYSGIGIIRAVLDALIVVLYVALLFFGSKVILSPLSYLLTFVAVFLLYLAVGFLRCKEYDTKASRMDIIGYHLGATLFLAIAFAVVDVARLPWGTTTIWIWVFAPLVVVVSFRWFREWRSLPWVLLRRTIAVDMDGVLVEQVVPVLQKLKGELGITLDKSDITDWEYPIGDTNIKIEIEKAEQQEQFIRGMPAMAGMNRAFQVLSSKYEIIVATSRQPNTDLWSRDWLSCNGVTCAVLVNTRSCGKRLPGVDILIDDYVGNILEFIRSGSASRQGILFAQPWNTDTTPIGDYIRNGRVRIAHSWQAVLDMLS